MNLWLRVVNSAMYLYSVSKYLFYVNINMLFNPKFCNFFKCWENQPVDDTSMWVQLINGELLCAQTQVVAHQFPSFASTKENSEIPEY